MKAMLVASDLSLVWSDVPDFEPIPGHILIKTVCAGVNRADLLQRAGKYPPPPGAPVWMGLEISGTVAALGEGCTRFAVGDAVCALLPGGGYAEYALVPEQQVMPIPEGLSFVQAASLPEAFATAWLNLFIEAGLVSGDTCCITAGSSGLASAAIQLAHAKGLRVLTSVRRDEAVDYCYSIGADVVVNTSRTSLASAFQEELDRGTPVKGVMDCLGGSDVGECLPLMAYGGRWVMIATLANANTNVNLTAMYKRGLRLIGSTLRPRPVEVKGQILSSLVSEIWPLLTVGSIRPQIQAVFPIAEAEAAHDVLQRGGHHGKVILSINCKTPFCN